VTCGGVFAQEFVTCEMLETPILVVVLTILFRPHTFMVLPVSCIQMIQGTGGYINAKGRQNQRRIAQFSGRKANKWKSVMK